MVPTYIDEFLAQWSIMSLQYEKLECCKEKFSKNYSADIVTPLKYKVR